MTKALAFYESAPVVMCFNKFCTQRMVGKGRDAEAAVSA